MQPAIVCVETLGTRSREATTQSVHQSFDARLGNQTVLSTLKLFVRTEITSSKLTGREKLIND